MKILAGDEEPDTGESSRPKKLGAAAGPLRVREDPRARRGDHGQQAPVGGDRREAPRCSRRPTSPRPTATAWASSRASSPRKTATPPSPTRPRCSRAWASRSASTRGRSRQLTGGFKLRVLLAQALFGKPEGLLLDEPTNNLDLDSIRWLESFLHEYEGVLITISHDRHFLNAICTHIADIDYETIIIYPGGYDDMVPPEDPGALPRRVGERREAEEDRPAQGLRRALPRRHARRARCRAARSRSRSSRSRTSSGRTSSGPSSSSSRRRRAASRRSSSRG